MKRKHSSEDYVRFFHIYIDRRVFMLLLLLVLCIPIFFFRRDLQQLLNRITNQNMEAATFSYNDLNLQNTRVM